MATRRPALPTERTSGRRRRTRAALTQTFTVYNTGTAALTLGTPKLPAGYTITEPLEQTIAAGEQRHIYGAVEYGQGGNVRRQY